MSDLTETVQELYAAFGRGDLQGILAKLADDVVWESEGPAVVSFSGIRHGKTEAKGFFEALVADHANPRLTITDYVASGDTVMTLGRYTATMKATGKEFDSPIAHYFKFRDGKVVRYVGLANTAEAVEALRPSNLPAEGAFTIAYGCEGITLEQYREVLRRLELAGEGAPSGRLFHACYGPPDSIHVFDGWASLEQFEWLGKTLRPILDSLGIKLDAPEVLPLQNSIAGQ